MSGTLTSQSCQLNELTVYGDAKLDNTTVKGPTRIYGHLQASDSNFTGTIYVHGNQLTLNHVQANRICVSSQQTPKVQVTGHSNIQIIEFTDQPGQAPDHDHQVKQIINHQQEQ